MPISNKVKGYISLIQTMLIALGANTMFSDPHSYFGLALMVAAAIVGAVKHWADTQDNTVPPVPQGPTS